MLSTRSDLFARSLLAMTTRLEYLRLLRGYPEIVDQSDGDQVENLIEKYASDVVLLDQTLHRCSGLEALAMVRSRWSGLSVIVLVMHSTRDNVNKAMQLGASGYLLKDSAVIELQLSLHAVLSGHRSLFLAFPPVHLA